MAAILCPDQLDETLAPSPVARPPLRVIPGGGSRGTPAATYWRRRLVALTLASAALVAGGRGLDVARDAGARWAAPQHAALDGPTVPVEARAGDTLWTIARRVHPDGDVRPVVEAMLADRGTADVQIGDEVRVPSD